MREPRTIIREVNKARRFLDNTCPYSRHVQIIGEALIKKRPYPMMQEEPEHVGHSLLATVESLYRARTALTKHGIDWSSWEKIGSEEDLRFKAKRQAEVDTAIGGVRE